VLYRGNIEEGPLDMARVIAVGKGGVLMTGEASPASESVRILRDGSVGSPRQEHRD
jgi:hypothetical protein